jgi:thiamine pyrophosphate-dependent acetolactate synthase large subunit-like protein
VTVADAFARALGRWGVEVVFGLLSDEIMDLVVSLEAAGIQFVGARQETQAVLMAEGFSFASGRLGVAAIGRGAATTNALSGTIYASRSGSKVLVIFGDEPLDAGNPGGPDIKRIDGLHACGVFAAAGVDTFPVPSAAAAVSVLEGARARAERGHAAALFLPTSLQLEQVEDRRVAPPAAASPAREPAAAAAIDAAVTALERSERPLILAGWGAFEADAAAPLEALAQRIGALLCTTVKAKDYFRGNPYNLGLLGSFSHAGARRFVDQTDCVLAVGAGLNLYTMSHGGALPPVPIVQIDAERTNIGRWTSVQVPVVGDGRVAVEQIIQALPTAEKQGFRTQATRRFLDEYDPADDFEDTSSPRNIDPRTLAIELNAVLPNERTFVYDAGNFLHVLPFLEVPDPAHLKMTSESGSIGLGLANAIGVSRARPDTTTVLVIGDGGLLMTLGELETVARTGAPIVIVVMNDRAYGAERHILELRRLPTGTSLFPEVDFAAIATDLGIEAVTIAVPGDVREKLAPLLAAQAAPLLVDCLVNPNVAAPFITEMIDVRSN